MTPKPGDLVTVPFTGAVETKRRPAIVVSSDVYHANRPDIIVAVLTTNVAAAKGPTIMSFRIGGRRGCTVPPRFAYT